MEISQNFVASSECINFTYVWYLTINKVSVCFSDDCNCGKVVLIHLNLTDAQADSFCPRCVCKYQTRSLAIIKVVVILVVWVVLLLLFYMAFLSLLEPILNKKRCAGLPGLDRNISYREHHDADTDGKKIKILNMYLQMIGIFSLELKSIPMFWKSNRNKLERDFEL